MVENFMQKEDMVYTSGYEIVQQLKPDAKLEEPIKHTFYHTWIKKNGNWILVAKNHNQTD
jgi:2-hydroxy-3-keto-5-methylthiopentenyl-1-phosphate phosphatase